MMNRQIQRKTDDYADIIDLEYHGTITHIPMPMEKRAAQFSPFAALTGLGDKYDEEMRYTDEKIELTEDRIEKINRSIQHISEALSGKKTAEAIITWFIPDLTKEGGMYRTDRVTIRKMDEIGHSMILADKTEIPLENITDIAYVDMAEDRA